MGYGKQSDPGSQGRGLGAILVLLALAIGGILVACSAGGYIKQVFQNVGKPAPVDQNHQPNNNKTR